ncbi:MAG: sulfatase [Bacteroidota bacterium]
MKFHFTFPLLLICLLAANITKAQTSIPDRPNIVFLLSEDNSMHYQKLFDEHGAKMPNLEKVAAHGLVFERAFSNAPVCSVARSTLITSCYAPRIGTQFHRKSQIVPMPKTVRMFPAYLRDAGYYTTNNHKEDYNASKATDVWDESSKQASWKNRKKGQSFFHQQNIGNTHESSLHFDLAKKADTKLRHQAEEVFVAPIYPDTEMFRFTMAYYLDQQKTIDDGLAKVLRDLEEAGELENTFVFYFGDHGGVLPGSKGYVYERGLHVPLVVRIPENFKYLVDAEFGERIKGFVSFIDFGATALHLAGIQAPKGIDGKAFMGKGITQQKMNKADIAYGYADRFDEKYDMVRSVRKGKYKYIRYYEPFYMDALQNNYRYKMLAYEEWRTWYKDGKLNDIQSHFFEAHPVEALYDVEKDPYETNNLAQQTDFQATVKVMRKQLNKWMKSMPDLSFYPESELAKAAFKNPTTFGQSHKKEIKKLMKIADLGLLPFDKAKQALEKALASSDKMEKYWALSVCSSFGKEASSLSSIVKTISEQDASPLIQARAGLFLALIKQENPVANMKQALKNAESSTEAAIILNMIVFLEDQHQHSFNLTRELITEKFFEDRNVEWRLKYLMDEL